MGIERQITRICKQTAVYWANPKSDGSGGTTYTAGREIKCKWFDETEIISGLKGDAPGKERISNAHVYVLEDLDEQGQLFLGELTDLSSAEEAAPELIEDSSALDKAYTIIKTGKLQGIQGKDYLRKVYL